MHEIILPTVDGMAKDGIPFTGFLYAGLMIDAQGHPKTLEFNTRMGDPETQPIMMRLKSDLAEVLMHATDGTLDQVELQWDRRVALGVVMAAAGYPGDAAQGRPHHRPAGRHRRGRRVPRRHRAGRRRHHGHRRPRAVRHRAGRLHARRAAARLRDAAPRAFRRRAASHRHRAPCRSPSVECWDAGGRDIAVSRARATDAQPHLRHRAADAAATRVRCSCEGSALARGVMRLFGWRVVRRRTARAPGRGRRLSAHVELGLLWGLLAKWAIGLPCHVLGQGHAVRSAAVRPLAALAGRHSGRCATRPTASSARWPQRLREARERDEFMWLGLSPEGTRQRTPGWRSGFHQVALQAGVPVALAYSTTRGARSASTRPGG